MRVQAPKQKRALTAPLAIITISLALASPTAAQKTRFDPARDYSYDLHSAATSSTSAAWKEATAPLGKTRVATLIWSGATANATILLELRVNGAAQTSAISARTVPSSGGTSSGTASLSTIQYFEPGARGVRYLDLTPFRASAPNTEIEVRAHKLRFSLAGTTLHSFENEPLDGQRVLVLAPHPDDAEIAAFGLYAATDSDVVTVTSGDAGGFNYRSLIPDPEQHYREKGRIRVWDSITVPFLGGVPPERARNLGYYDATLQRLFERQNEAAETTLADLEYPGWYRSFNIDSELRNRPFEGTWQALVRDLQADIQRVQPNIIASTHPLLDGHWDHQFTTIALIEALEGLRESNRLPNNKTPQLFLYTNHPNEEEGFPFGPRDGMPSLPPWFDEPLNFSALRSLQLDEATQDLKLLALEMMHDLRPLDLHPPIRPRTHLARYFRALGKSFKGKAPDYRYFRRAARPAEMFFVLDLDQATLLKNQFLANFKRRFADVE